MHVTFDIDGVMADFAGGFAGILRERFGIDTDPRACKSWYWTDWVDGLTREMENQAWTAIFEEPRYKTFWQELDPLMSREEVERINALSEKNVVSFLTQRSGDGQHGNIREVTVDWLGRHGFDARHNTFICSPREKGRRARMLGTHIMIEDNGDNCTDLLDCAVGVSMLKRPYNQSYADLVATRGGHVVDTLEEFLAYVEAFEGVEQRWIKNPNGEPVEQATA